MERITIKTSTEIVSIANHIGEEKAVEYVAKAGFDAWDFSMCGICQYDWDTKTAIANDHPISGREYLSYARHLKKIGLDNGIVCNQSHAPFPTYMKNIETYLKRAIECTAEAGGKICVIHPMNVGTPEENAQMYLKLLPFAKGCSVKIATENMWNWDDEKDQSCFAACATPESFCAHLKAVNDEDFVACLDIGHAEMRGSDTTAVEMIKALGKRVQALHIHDNDKWLDSHQIPFSMQIDFEKIVKALKEIDYKGDFTLEANSFLRDYTSDNVFEGVKKLADSARRLANMYDDIKI